ncbi:MAG: hypothetical protein NC548_57525 [Lachnospiraceae bacterium]|nr:hypothetical protein [Lachnospiraceae bacterium]
MAKILTLPVNPCQAEVKEAAESTYEVTVDSAVNQLVEDVAVFLEVAEATLPQCIFKDTDVDENSIENWNRYKKIFYALMGADKDGASWNLFSVMYRKEPSMIHNYASVTITLQKDQPITGEAKTAFTIAALFADQVVMTVNNGNPQICFTVNNIRRKQEDDKWE